MFNQLTPVVRTLLLLNVAIFLTQTIMQIDIPAMFGLRYIGGDDFAPWQLLTYMFIHSATNVGHILSNMLGLFMFGTWIENVLGSRRFLAFYMVCGMGAGMLNNGVIYVEHTLERQSIEAFAKTPTPTKFVEHIEAHEHFLYQANKELVHSFVQRNGAQASELELKRLEIAKRNDHVVIGASGAIFGILMAFMLIFPNIKMQFMLIPVEVKAKYLVSFYMVYELVAGFGYAGISNVAHFAHLAGALVAFLLIKFWKIKREY